MNVTTMVGNVSTDIKKREVGEDTYAYNFGFAVNYGYGENQKVYFYNCVCFAKKGAQEKFYDNVIKKGNRLPLTGTLAPGRPFVKEGVEITPWVFTVRKLYTGINNVFITGNLTDDATVTQKGETVIARFTVAVNRTKDETDFIKCVRFGKGGFFDFANAYLKKGKSIAVMGSEHTGSYVNREGAKVYTEELYVQDFQLFGEKKESTTSATDATPSAPTNATSTTPTTPSMDIPDMGADQGFIPIGDEEDEDLPF